MRTTNTNDLLSLQALCNKQGNKFIVASDLMDDSNDIRVVGPRVKRERESRGWSQGELASRITGILAEQGFTRVVKQQSVDQVEKVKLKSLPDWVRLVWDAFSIGDDETKYDKHLHTGKTDNSVMVRLLPTFVGLGTGGNGDDDEGEVAFSRDLIENELRVPTEYLLAMVAEGNSMEPDFRGGDQILVDTRRKSLAQPGAFCLWDGDGHVIKYLERIQGSEPSKVKVISANGIYDPFERLEEEIAIIGRVCWYGRRVH